MIHTEAWYREAESFDAWYKRLQDLAQQITKEEQGSTNSRTYKDRVKRMLQTLGEGFFRGDRTDPQMSKRFQEVDDAFQSYLKELTQHKTNPNIWADFAEKITQAISRYPQGSAERAVYNSAFRAFQKRIERGVNKNSTPKSLYEWVEFYGSSLLRQVQDGRLPGLSINTGIRQRGMYLTLSRDLEPYRDEIEAWWREEFNYSPSYQPGSYSGDYEEGYSW